MNADAQELLWTGFHGLDAAEVELGFKPGGIVLFARNLDADPERGPARAHALIQGLQARWGSKTPLAVAIDQEGGAVSRLRVWTGPTPTLYQIWMLGGAQACERWGKRWGRGLRLLGINVDFAPVADLFDGHEGTGLGDRAASADPRETAQAAGAFMAGLEAEGVRGCLKHFPGLGGTRIDSHKGLPELDDADGISKNLGPFLSLAHEDRLVMVAHLKTPFTQGLPASLHRGTVAENPWGIQARWLPDDLEMGGCAAWPWPDRVRRCLEAGHQALLVCQTPEGIQACAEAAAGLPETLWAPALKAFRCLRANLSAGPSFGVLPFDAPAWEVWLRELREAAQRELRG